MLQEVLLEGRQAREGRVDALLPLLEGDDGGRVVEPIVLDLRSLGVNGQGLAELGVHLKVHLGDSVQ
eukprot:9617765-Alexandrium_andersonii.AAC.1